MNEKEKGIIDLMNTQKVQKISRLDLSVVFDRISYEAKQQAKKEGTLECCRCNNTIEGEIPQAFCWECVTKICKSNEESYRYEEKKESKN